MKIEIFHKGGNTETENNLLVSSRLIIIGLFMVGFGSFIVPLVFSIFQNTPYWELFSIPELIYCIQMVSFAVAAVALVVTGIPWFCLSLLIFIGENMWKFLGDGDGK
jgi:hypothetical protein